MTPSMLSEAERARAALAVIPADDYQTWIDMAFAIKAGFGDEGFELWDAWSRTAENYDARAARATWRSARASGGTTLATLFWHARQNGFEPARTHEFERRATASSASASLEQVQVQAQAQRAREHVQRQARQASVAREAASIWQWARPVGPSHPYLVRKHLKPQGTLRELEAPELRTLLGYAPASDEQTLSGRVLLVPVWNGPISTLELIDERGLKSSLAGGAKKGGFWMTGAMPVAGRASSPILIAEGMATALSASCATGWFAAAALSSGNLSLVATQLREQYPEAELIVLGELGGGEIQAQRSAHDARARVAWPRFAAHARIDENVPSDFCDMAVLTGFDVVGAHLREFARCVPHTHDAGAMRWNQPEEGGEMGNVKETRLSEDADGAPRRSSRRSASRPTGAQRAAAREASAAATPVDPPTQHAVEQPAVEQHAVEQPADPKVDAQDITASIAAPASPAPEGDATRPTPSRWLVGEALFGVSEVPHEIRTLAEHRFGSPLHMGTPRENGGPYRGEVFNTEHYLIQEVAPRSVVFHRKDHMTFVSERLKWMNENARLNGSELQVSYDGREAKLYPWDRARDVLDRTVRSLKKSARELNVDSSVDDILDQLRTRSWARIRELRTEALAKSKQAHVSPNVSPDVDTEPDR